MRLGRDRLTFKLWAGVAVIAGCSRLTAVDWDRIPTAQPGGAGSGATDAGGEDAGGQSSQSGQAGEGGGLDRGEGGAQDGGAPGSGTSGSAGFAAAGGGGGSSGSGGAGGSAGGGGSAGTGGAAGSAGTGGSATEEMIPPCTGVESPVVAADLVLFSGGNGTPGAAWGGRAGLDSACNTARAALGLPQTHAHAFITVDGMDFIARWTIGQFTDIPPSSRVVGPTGIRLATSFADLIDVTMEQSFVCAKVVGPEVKRWLNGGRECRKEGASDPDRCGQFGGLDDTCSSWTLGSYDAITQARWGFTMYAGQKAWWGDYEATRNAKVACSKSTDPILCLAYTPISAP